MAEQIREIAERILFASTIEDKLLLGPHEVGDSSPGKAIKAPEVPTRPSSLMISDKGVRAEFPSMNRLEEEKERGVMLHFLANHELLAAELMALALLKFPDAPGEYRQGVYKAMREEQIHTQLYLRRMRECGIYFGELPLNDFFWRIVSPMETTMEFVIRMNLTFEQANLDFSKFYAAQFREAGDTSTAAILEKIYQDELGHVGHGLQWFRRWKRHGQSDWEAFTDSLHFPLSPARAKGVVPFNSEGRSAAGFDENFISRLRVCEQSRGRTPVIHWFNPNAELHALAVKNGTEFRANRFERALEEDLEILMLAWGRRDDVALFRKVPSTEHLTKLQGAGFQLPEIISLEGIGSRKLGGLRPWAWSADASELLRPYAEAVSDRVPWQWREPLPEHWLSKEIGVRLEEKLGLRDPVGGICEEVQSALNLLKESPILFKSAFGCAGKGQLVAQHISKEVEEWLEEKIALHGFVVAESWLDRVEDFSVLYEMRQGEVEWVGMTQIINDDAGRFRGIRVAPKWSKTLDSEVSEFLFRDALLMDWYRKKIPASLEKLLPGYSGPVGVDAMVWRRKGGELALRHVVELNVRMTMGRVALELQKKTAPDGWGTFRIERKGRYRAGKGIALNDPLHALEFVAVWESHQGDSEALTRK